MSTMQNITVKRAALIAAISENRDSHRETFLEAQRGYREAVVEELDKMLADARSGAKIKRHISLPEPEDHTDDYNKALRMLAMCVDEEIEISAMEFGQYVMDDWGWKKNWTDTVSNYASIGN